MEKGIRIHSRKPFGRLFSGTFTKLQGLIWLFDSNSFEGGSDELWNSLSTDIHLVSEPGRFGAVHEFGCWSRKNIFPKYADMVREDWNWFFGSEKTNLNGDEWLKQYFQVTDRASYVKQHCYVCFLNIDAAYWEFYVQDDALLKSVEEHLLKIGEVKTETCSLKTSAGL